MRNRGWGPRLRTAAWAVVRRRCPNCGQDPAFTGWWNMREACGVCGRRFHRHPGSTTGVMQVGSLAVVLFAFTLWFLITGLTQWPLLPALGAMVIGCTLFGLWFHPYAKLIWEAVDSLIDSAQEDEQ